MTTQLHPLSGGRSHAFILLQMEREKAKIAEKEEEKKREAAVTKAKEAVEAEEAAVELAKEEAKAHAVWISWRDETKRCVASGGC